MCTRVCMDVFTGILLKNQYDYCHHYYSLWAIMFIWFIFIVFPSHLICFILCFFYQMCFYATKNKGTSCMWWGTSMQKGHSSGRPLGDDWNWDERGGWCAANVRCSDSNPGLLQRGQGLCRQDAHPYQLSCPSGHICCIFIGGILCVKKKKDHQAVTNAPISLCCCCCCFFQALVRC